VLDEKLARYLAQVLDDNLEGLVGRRSDAQISGSFAGKARAANARRCKNSPPISKSGSG
jgi:hypothetical protein